MPGNTVRINNVNNLEWYVGDSKMEDLIAWLDEHGVRDKPVVATVKNCARCQGTHEDMEFEKLFGEPVDGTEGDYTHWAMCPVKEQPIVLARVPRDKEQGFCLRDSNGSILIRFGSYEESEKWRSDPANADNDPIHGVSQIRINVGVGDTGNCTVWDVDSKTGIRARGLLRCVERSLREVGMKCTMKPLEENPVYPVVLDHGIVEKALLARYRGLEQKLHATRSANDDKESAEEDEILEEMDDAWQELTEDQQAAHEKSSREAADGQ